MAPAHVASGLAEKVRPEVGLVAEKQGCIVKLRGGWGGVGWRWRFQGQGAAKEKGCRLLRGQEAFRH